MEEENDNQNLVGSATFSGGLDEEFERQQPNVSDELLVDPTQKFLERMKKASWNMFKYNPYTYKAGALLDTVLKPDERGDLQFTKPNYPKLLNLTGNMALEWYSGFVDEVQNLDFETFHKEKNNVADHNEKVNLLSKNSSGKIVQTEGGTLYRAGDIVTDTFYSIDEPLDKGDKPINDSSLYTDTFRKTLSQGGMAQTSGDLQYYRWSMDSYNNFKLRRVGEQYLTPFGTEVPFKTIANMNNAELAKTFQPYLSKMGLGETRTFQTHHIMPIKAVLPAFEGIVYDSPRYHDIMKTFLGELLYTGNQKENYLAVLGHTARDKDSPHALVHQFIRDTVGQDGSKFWTPELLAQIEGNDKLRLEKVKEFAKIVNRGRDIVNIAQEEYRLLYGQDAVLPEEIVEYFTNSLPADLTKGEDGILKYSANKIQEVIYEAIEDTQNIDSVVLGDISRDEFSRRMQLITRPPDWWRDLNIQQKLARMKEITGTASRNYKDGWSYEQLEAFRDAGWMSDEKLDSFFND
tara:strand:+ start:52 stop:1605 length:1554 start_codon:yes stop_codon:yes gene_type:complete